VDREEGGGPRDDGGPWEDGEGGGGGGTRNGGVEALGLMERREEGPRDDIETLGRMQRGRGEGARISCAKTDRDDINVSCLALCGT
jgi:hypothetical protein